MTLRNATAAGVRSRTVLLGGFGILLALLVALGFYAAHALREARSAATESTRRYLASRDALGTLRTNIYRFHTRLRDYLVDPDENAAPGRREAARRGWAAVPEAAQRYRNAAGTGAGDPSRALEERLVEYDACADRALQLEGEARREEGFERLSGDLGTAREDLLAALENAAQANQDMLRRTIAETGRFLDRLENRLWLAIGLSVLVGGVVAWLIFHRLAALETQATTRYEELREAAAQLEHLSHRLMAVQEEERKALARELHDEVGQALGALLVDLGQARKELAGAGGAAGPRLQAAGELAERTLRSIRDISLLLRPSMLDDLGLVPALHWQAREVQRRSGLAVTIDAPGDELELDETRRTAVFRIVQEALQNAARHGHASEARVELLPAAGRLVIRIRDDGRGFDPGRSMGLGLLGIQERVSLLQGRFDIRSAPGAGTVLDIDLPLDLPLTEATTLDQDTHIARG